DPTEQSQAQAFGSKGAADVAGAGSDAVQDPDLAGSLQDPHGDGVDQPHHADGDDQQAHELDDREQAEGCRPGRRPASGTAPEHSPCSPPPPCGPCSDRARLSMEAWVLPVEVSQRRSVAWPQPVSACNSGSGMYITLPLFIWVR